MRAAVHDLTNYAEHVARLDAGEESALEFRVDDRSHAPAPSPAPSSPRSSPGPPGVLSLAGGFPNPDTFPTDASPRSWRG